METFLQHLLNGTSLGSIYALIALGYTLVYGILRLINFAHGDIFMVGAFAGLYQLQNQNPSFGQGVKGYAHRYWTAYIDQSMGNLMTEAVLPTLLHEDPRYFRKVSGTKGGRSATR